MNKGITYQAIKHRKLTIYMIIITILAGVYSYIMLPRQESPDLTAPRAQIMVVYPGATPAEMETYVTDVIEEELKEIEGYDNAQSVTKSNVTSILFEVEEGADIDQAFDELLDVMADIEAELPSGVTRIVTNTEIMETPGMILALTGADYTEEELAEYADQFKNELSKVNGVRRFDVYGDMDKEIDIEISHTSMNQYGLTVNEVINLINMENVNMPSGAIDNGYSKIKVSVDAEFNYVSEIEEVVLISYGDGRQVKLKDIAKVSYQNNPDDAKFSRNGESAVLLAGFFEDSLNVVTVGDEVELSMEALGESLPEGVEVSLMVFQPHDVEKSINEFMVNLIQAILFVIIVVFIGMGWRNAAVVSTVIPLSIALTMAIMYAFGVKLEQMSISGLIIALGMLVDNAIVISDSIQVHVDEGKNPVDAAIVGTKEVAFSILTSTFTTIFAFMPLLLLDSTLGKFVYGVPFVVTAALFASYLSSIITTPLMAALLFKKTKPAKVKKKYFVKGIFVGALRWSLKHRLVTLFFAVIYIALCALSIRGLEMTLLPKADKVMLEIDLTSEFASDITKTEELTLQAIELLEDIPELTEYYVSIGSNLPKFYLSVMYRADSPDIAQIAYIFDLSESERFQSKEDLQSHIQSILSQQLVGGSAETLLLELGNFARPIEVKMFSDDLNRLDEVRYDLTTQMYNTPGVLNISDDFSSQEYQFYVEVDEVKANYYGFTKLDIQKEIMAALMGLEATSFKKSGEEIPIVVSSDISSMEALENLGIKSSKTGQKILLKDLADIEMVSDFPVINHYSTDRSLTITADVASGYLSKEIENSLKTFIDEGDYEDVKFDFDGMTATIMKMVSDLGMLAVLAIFLILSVLILQFNSYRKPLIILSVIPLAMVSALAGLYFFGQDLSFIAMLSLLALMGIVVNNAIVLIDAIDAMRAGGMGKNEACLTAVNRRYRPIILSTTTTIIGLVPLLISGGELFRPLAIALMSGLGMSTILTMVIIPTIYSLVMGKDKVTEEILL